VRVLVVDDDAMARTIVSNDLRAAGYDVRCAADGRDALEVLREHWCRLVVTDWEMPHMSGIELCRAIRAEDMDAYVYVILLTSHDSPAERVAGLRAGADDFVVKPFHTGELRARVAAGERVLSLETRDVAIFALAKLAESRDAGTGAHLERVRSYSRILAQHLASSKRFEREIDAEQIRLVYMTSPLHDIGKVGIPDSVLLKPGRLTEAEFEVMKRHTSIGAHTLDAARQRFPEVKFLKMARDIAASHHERFDGRGYPDCLAGDDIPLAARIVAVADVYDALTSRRVYKEADSHEVARRSILDQAGTQFDPELVTAFAANEQAFEEIRARRPDDVEATVAATGPIQSMTATLVGLAATE